MEEISKENFWKLESKLPEIEKTTGKLTVSYTNDGGKLYSRGFKKWMRAMPAQNVWFADSSLVVKYLI